MTFSFWHQLAELPAPNQDICPKWPTTALWAKQVCIFFNVLEKTFLTICKNTQVVQVVTEMTEQKRTASILCLLASATPCTTRLNFFVPSNNTVYFITWTFLQLAISFLYSHCHHHICTCRRSSWTSIVTLLISVTSKTTLPAVKRSCEPYSLRI